MVKKIYFDMDGTIADLYADPNWKARLDAYDPLPYIDAKPMVNMSLLARYIHQVQEKGYEVGIISWLAKGSTPWYDMAVYTAKTMWLQKHLPSVVWNEVKIVAYGTPKHELCEGILFDDELYNRLAWGRGAYEPNEIFKVLKALV
jgi:hypothetical protein